MFNQQYITKPLHLKVITFHLVIYQHRSGLQIPILNSLLSITKMNGYSLTSLLVSPSKKFSLYAIKHFIS